MSTEVDPGKRDDMAGREPAPAPGQPAAPSGSGRWLLVAVVLVLVVYPAARWVLSRGGGTAAPKTAGAGQSELQLSYQHYEAGRYQEAITAAKAALAKDPKSADAYNNMAVAYMGLRQIDNAIEVVQNAIRLKPDYQLAKNNLAWFQQEKATTGLPPVQQAQLAQAGALLTQSLEHAQAGRFKECVESAAQAAKLDPGSARAYNNLGICQANLKQWDEGIKNTHEAIRLDPTMDLAKNNLAWMQQEKLKAGSSTRK